MILGSGGLLLKALSCREVYLIPNGAHIHDQTKCTKLARLPNKIHFLESFLCFSFVSIAYCHYIYQTKTFFKKSQLCIIPRLLLW